MREQLGGAQPRSRVNPPPRHLLWGPNTIEAGTRFAGACGFISIPPHLFSVWLSTCSTTAICRSVAEAAFRDANAEIPTQFCVLPYMWCLVFIFIFFFSAMIMNILFLRRRD